VFVNPPLTGAQLLPWSGERIPARRKSRQVAARKLMGLFINPLLAFTS
jgi:hypothetical protein